MRLPEAILFDLDNTAYAYDPCHTAGMEAAHDRAASIDRIWAEEDAFSDAYRRARERVKGRVGERAASHCRLLYFKSMIEDLLGRSDLEAASDLEEAYWKGYFSAMRPDAGCPALLEELRKWGIKTAWISNFTTGRTVLKLRHMGLEKAADLLVTSEEAGSDKPDPAVVDHALGLLGARPSRTWLVGDSLRDDLGAGRARGLTVVWFQREPEAHRPGPAGARGPDHVVTSWRELRDLLEDGKR